MKLRRTLIIAGTFLLLGNGCTGTVVLQPGASDDRDLRPSSHFVTYTAEREFEPNTYRIPVGETLNFVNESATSMRPVSDGLFRADTSLEPNELYQYTFLKTGTYRYHDEENPESTGTVVVVNE